jgi:hypothetical protein
METTKFKENHVITFLVGLQKQHGLGYISLVGGATIDILDGRTPKDYDLIVHNSHEVGKALLVNGYVLKFETATAITYVKDKTIIQLLKTHVGDFDFIISQAEYIIARDTISINEEHYRRKLLIPCNFENKKYVLNSLYRLPHWIKKGYRIDNATYYSMLNALNNKLDNTVTVYRQS